MRVALALGAGGARGYAHIGVIRELHERGHEIVAISGASMGAMVGGMTAAGKLDEFADWVSGLSRRDVIRLVDPHLSAPGVITAERLFAALRSIVGEPRIEDLDIPFTAVATDLRARREVWFQRGDLLSALRASVAMPGVFTPVVINGRLLGDGGVLNPVPIEPTSAANADVTVAVSLHGNRLSQAPAAPAKEEAEPSWRDNLVEKVRERMGHTPTPEHPGEGLLEGMKIADVMGLSNDAAAALITRFRLAATPPDVLIKVPGNAAGTLDLYKATEMIELGRTLAVKALDAGGY
jgi:NTE family protein